ncbi:HET-domain-containing protein [Apiospora arundinis]|uniref:HET-domain-containing protein n=1 Tax=Apiospora arundinis TaxID=335852 RepID=A0ABR2I8N4_9PEZI
MEWHDASCRRLDLVPIGGLNSCLSCGSFEEPSIQDDASPAETQTPSPSRNDALENATYHAPIRQKSETRILILQPGEFEEPVCGDLVVVDLPPKEPYEALSYTWADESGDSTPCKTMQLSGRPLLITTNCENALRRIRRRFSSRHLWVDAICIDQNNISERGHQVQLMPSIYSEAQSVLIYVGEAAHDSDGVFSVISSSDPLLATPTIANGLKLRLDSFFERRYFHRIWVLQEVALARHAKLICGASSVSWATFRSYVGTQLFRAPILRFDHHSYTDPQQLVSMMLQAANCQCHDPRDKVYGLLGLFPHTAGRVIRPDYNLSVEEVYTDMARYIASEFSWALVLNLASKDTLHPPFGWPSWVPNWGHSSRSDHRRDFDETLKSNPGLSIELQLLELPHIEAPELHMPSVQFKDIPRYYFPEEGHQAPSERFFMFVEGSYMFRALLVHAACFPEQNLRASQVNVAVFTANVTEYLGPNVQKPHKLAETRILRVTTEPMPRPSESGFQQFKCITVASLLRYFRDHVSIWDDCIAAMRKWASSFDEPFLDTRWRRALQDMSLRRIRNQAERLRPVDEGVEALWAMPEWNDVGTLKRRWFSHNAAWASFPIVIDEFLRIAGALPPADGESEGLLPEPADEHYANYNLGWGDRGDSFDLALGQAWMSETKRALGWRILLRFFLPNKINAIIV